MEDIQNMIIRKNKYREFEQISDIVEVLEEMKNEIKDIPKIKDIKILFSGHDMGLYDPKTGIISIHKRILSNNFEMLDEGTINFKENISDIEKNSTDTDEIENAKRKSNFEFFNAYSKNVSAIKNILYHEIGHHVYHSIIKSNKYLQMSLNNLYNIAHKHLSIYAISAYSEKNINEFFAEIFVLYKVDKTRLSTSMIQYINNIIEKKYGVM